MLGGNWLNIKLKSLKGKLGEYGKVNLFIVNLIGGILLSSLKGGVYVV